MHKSITIFGVLLVISVLISCAQKEVVEPAQVEDVPQTEDTTPDTPVLDQITKEPQEPEEIKITEEIKPKEKETAVAYPRPEDVKKSKPQIEEDSWFLVGGVTGDRAYSVFVDPETIGNSDGLINSWSKLEFENPQRDEDGLAYSEVLIQSEVDCEKRTYSYTDSKFYDSLGRLVESQRTPYEPKPIVDGTVSSKIADFVCGYVHNQ